MTSGKLQFKTLHLTQSPGLPKGVEELSGLSPQINVVSGPNASGKSSLARAIQRLLWDDAGADRAGASGEHQGQLVTAAAEMQILEDDASGSAQNWQILLQPSGRTVRREGAEQAIPSMPSPAVNSNYMLTLQDLITGEENGLAAYIRREAIGGYDLSSIPNRLGYSPKVSTANISEAREAKEAVTELEEQQKDQKKLVQRQKSLENLKALREEAKKAERYLEVLDLVLEIRRKNEDVDVLTEQIESRPEAMNYLRDEDASDVKDLESNLQTCRTDLARKIEERQELIREVERFGFPEEGPDRSKLRLLEELTDKLEKTSEEMERLRQECNRLDGEMKALFDHPNPDWAGDFPNLEARGRLDQQWHALAEKVSRKSAEEVRLKTLHESLESLTNDLASREDGADRILVDDIATGITLLSQWLSTSILEEDGEGHGIVHHNHEAAGEGASSDNAFSDNASSDNAFSDNSSGDNASIHNSSSDNAFNAHADNQAAADSKEDAANTTARLKRSAAITTLLLSFAIMLTIALTYTSGAAGLLGSVPVAYLIWRLYTLIRQTLDPSESAKPDRVAQIRQIRENDYHQTGLKPPKTWQTRAVADRLHQLTEMRKHLQQRDIYQTEIRETEARIARIQTELEPILTNINPIRETLAGQLYFEDQQLASPTGLYDVVRTLQQWQQKRSEYLGKRAQMEEVKAQFDASAATFQNVLSEYLPGTIKSPLEFANAFHTTGTTITAIPYLTAFKELEKTAEEYQTEVKNLETVESDIRRLEDQKKSGEQQMAQIAQRLKTSGITVETLQHWTSQLSDFREWVQSRERLKNETSMLKNQAARKLEDDELLETWLQLDLPEAQRQREEKKEEASQYDEINNEIVAIQEQIKSAGDSSELQRLVRKKNDALEKLKEAYEENMRKIAGDTILKLLNKEISGSEMPAVFNRAKELFARITHNRYRLGVVMTGDGVFYAFDEVDKTEKQLDELSTGTKIQLLMAVRLAYIEESERGLKLPVLVDELLANSDDERSAAMIGALCEISRTGRQVFYFTAQEDEVQRWKHQVADDEVQLKHFELG